MMMIDAIIILYSMDLDFYNSSLGRALLVSKTISVLNQHDSIGLDWIHSFERRKNAL